MQKDMERVSVDISKVRVLDKAETERSLPVVDEECPECGNRTAYFWTKQMLPVDEPETRFYKCTKCGKTWREYH